MSVNESEARLADLTRQTFLSMWSCQNPFHEKGKELCDVPIVIGNEVIIISDKVISYAEDKSPEVAWGRWYRKAVFASVRQLEGALKTIKSTSEAIHLDAKVSSSARLRISMPNVLLCCRLAVSVRRTHVDRRRRSCLTIKCQWAASGAARARRCGWPCAWAVA
jgi:hypothetical protein